MNDRQTSRERCTVAQQIASAIGLLGTGTVVFNSWGNGSAVDHAALPTFIGMLMISPFATGLIVGLLNAIQFRGRALLSGILITGALIVGLSVLRNALAEQLLAEARCDSATWTFDYAFLVVMLPIAAGGAAIGTYLGRAGVSPRKRCGIAEWTARVAGLAEHRISGSCYLGQRVDDSRRIRHDEARSTVRCGPYCRAVEWHPIQETSPAGRCHC